ncbi:ABC transporter permease [Spiribacter onubensis]|uniref:ABC transporter permease n=1 Tax=Spiribacter onubensis TaxID=3122420 RepID=A0ABV3S9N3_9GAMM
MMRTNRVSLFLALLALLGVVGLDAVRIQPNRIVAGTGHSLLQALGPGGLIAVCLPLGLIALLALRSTRTGAGIMLALVMALLLALPWGLGAAVGAFIEPGQNAARAAIAGGTWLLGFALMLMLVDLRQRLRMRAGPTGLLWGFGLASLVMSLTSGWLDQLALIREYLGRSESFLDAVIEHLVLVGLAVGASLVIAVALALWMRRMPRVRQGTLGVLSFIQTIPSLALFGLLLAPLAWLAARYPLLSELGIQGIGLAPALLALVGYSLLPMTRNAYIALESVDDAVIESARGMGMGPLQVFFRVRLPLALPLLIEGVRITTVQAIGLAAVAALIGAGGLGTFIFQGLGQAAMNLVMLGALPIVIMAMLVDALLKGLAGALRRGDSDDRA